MSPVESGDIHSLRLSIMLRNGPNLCGLVARLEGTGEPGRVSSGPAHVVH